MGKIRRIDFSPDEWIAGTQGMTLEEEGAYIRIVARYYSRGEAPPSDPTELAHLCNVRPQVMRRLLAKLAPKFDETGGKLRSNRCETELKLARNRVETAQINGAKGGRPNGLAKPDGSQSEKPNHQPSTTNHQPTDKNNASHLSGKGETDVPALMTEIWNEECGGFAKAHKPSPSRRASCLKRWREDFGSDAERWRAYCRHVAACGHLRGENDRGWRADLDWVLKPANISHIEEGRYDERSGVFNGSAGPDAPPPAFLFDDDDGSEVGLPH